MAIDCPVADVTDDSLCRVPLDLVSLLDDADMVCTQDIEQNLQMYSMTLVCFNKKVNLQKSVHIHMHKTS